MAHQATEQLKASHILEDVCRRNAHMAYEITAFPEKLCGHYADAISLSFKLEKELEKILFIDDNDE